jgi:L-aminopeptidase/D-esterase-like protein
MRIITVVGFLLAPSSVARGDEGGPPPGGGQAPPGPRTAFGGPTLDFDFDSMLIGTAEYEEGPTGATVFAFPKRAAAAIDVRGGGPGTTGSDILRLGYEAPFVDAIVFAGGSAYGLEAADGVRAELLATGKRGTRLADVAIVPGAIVFDFLGRTNSVYPDKDLGRAALRAARPGQFFQGAGGAGRHVSVGKYFGLIYREPSGQGGAFRQIGPTKVAVFVVVNAVGSIVDRQGRVVRGNRDPDSGVRTLIGDDLMDGIGARKRGRDPDSPKDPVRPSGENTTLTLVVTNRKLAYWELQRLAVQVHTSMARAIQPFHTRYDGDVLFAVSTAEVEDPGLDAIDLSTIASELSWDAVLSSIPKSVDPAAGPES